MQPFKSLTRILVFVVTLQAVAPGAEPAPVVEEKFRKADPYCEETAAQRDARMSWWREARFGMFIHWGIYAVPAGVYEGEPVANYGEWILRLAQIPVQRYRDYAKEFNPVEYDPQAWAKLAKEAGMRYLVITSKHHDGFALFPSKYTDWDIEDATPYKKDLIGPLAKAVRQEGLKFGLYYSQALDWMHPGGAKGGGMKPNKGWSTQQNGEFDDYLYNYSVPQLKEILTRYQPAVLWWDIPDQMTPERGAGLIKHLNLVPGIIHNDRLGGGFEGDTETPEQYVPATGYPGRDWESCMTMNRTWGYKSTDHDWKSAKTLVSNLTKTASQGGNYLLNIGPDARGNIPEESVRLLKEVGAWMRVNGEAIYGTQASPFSNLHDARCTVKADGNDTILYLHVADWPVSRKLHLKGMKNQVLSAKLLANGHNVKVVPNAFGPLLELPEQAPDALSSTVLVRISGSPEVEDIPVIPDTDGILRFGPLTATLEGEGLEVKTKRQDLIITNWSEVTDAVSWKCANQTPGRYRVRIAATTKGEAVTLQLDGAASSRIKLQQQKGKDRWIEAGEVELKAGETLRLIPVAEGWQPVQLMGLELVPL